MRDFLKHLLSESGSISAMRMAFLCWITVITLTICGCILIVVIDKKEFPSGMWQAFSALAGSGIIGFGAKYLQKRTEVLTPPAKYDASIE